MTVTTVNKDPEGLTMALTAELDASVERAWQLWADPRQLERWWGPPSHPATFIDHDLTPGRRATYFMTGPDGEKYHGWWEILAVDAPRRLEVRDGFADENGTPNDEMPTTSSSSRSPRSPRAARAWSWRRTSRPPRRWSRCCRWAPRRG